MATLVASEGGHAATLLVCFEKFCRRHVVKPEDAANLILNYRKYDYMLSRNFLGCQTALCFEANLDAALYDVQVNAIRLIRGD